MFKRKWAFILISFFLCFLVLQLDVQAISKKISNITNITMDKTALEVFEHKTLKLSYSIKPKKASASQIIFSSSNSKVAKVNKKGIVRGIKEGTATITIQAKSNKSIVKKVKIIVKPAVIIQTNTKNSKIKVIANVPKYVNKMEIEVCSKMDCMSYYPKLKNHKLSDSYYLTSGPGKYKVKVYEDTYIGELYASAVVTNEDSSNTIYGYVDHNIKDFGSLIIEPSKTEPVVHIKGDFNKKYKYLSISAKWDDKHESGHTLEIVNGKVDGLMYVPWIGKNTFDFTLSNDSSDNEYNFSTTQIQLSAKSKKQYFYAAVNDGLYKLIKLDISDNAENSMIPISIDSEIGIKSIKLDTDFKHTRTFRVYNVNGSTINFEAYIDQIGTSTIGGVLETINGEEIFFDKKIKNSDIKDRHYLFPSLDVQSNDPQITQLANQITVNTKDDYEKLKAIHDWVSGNISYDWKDARDESISNKNDAITVLQRRMGVCKGYSTLTAALLRAVGIPTKVISGVGVGMGIPDWDYVDKTQSNHAWNEAYVDNRWIILDTTWDADESVSYDYFDISAEKFAINHFKIEETGD